ncbi:hypothetical protein FDECE_11183 [Fusarium decemcellulare]|nr:hypothetical protein FDECE_11183 [Fusarium decemcellulare]
MASHGSEKGSSEPNNLPDHLLPSSSGSHLTVAGEDEPSMALKEGIIPNAFPHSEIKNTEILQLARRYTAASHATAVGSPFASEQSGGPLDPSSPSFNARKWARAFYNVRTNIANLWRRYGQAILYIIHQPSAILSQLFDRLRHSVKVGRTVYFGEIGKNSSILLNYFVHNGGPACPPDANPAEHMLEVIRAAPGAHTDVDWPDIWRSSPEYQFVYEELSRVVSEAQPPSGSDSTFSEFAVPFSTQLAVVTKRAVQHYWRSPIYLFSKAAFLSCGTASSPFVLKSYDGS